VFCAPAGARDEPVPDLRAAMAEAEALVDVRREVATSGIVLGGSEPTPAAPSEPVAEPGQAALFDRAAYERPGGGSEG